MFWFLYGYRDWCWGGRAIFSYFTGSTVVGMAAWGAYNLPAPDNPYTGDRQKEYERMKKQCDKKPRQTGNKCTDLSREIDHQENCFAWYSWWDNKWIPGDNKHLIKKQNFEIRAERLKKQYKRECENQCQ